MKQRVNDPVKNHNFLKHYGRRLVSLTFLLCAFCCSVQSAAYAEGSRTLYPSSAPTGSARANLEWTTTIYGGIVLRRSLLKVYVNAGEYILLGSSAVRVGSGDILVYNPGRIGGNIGSETIPTTPDFRCSTQSGRGVISSRAQELAGPRSISGTANTSGYNPCYYQAPSTGIYNIAFYGPNGGNAATSGTPTGEINLSSANNFNTNQATTIAAWDVTIRNSNLNSTTDFNGRLFAYYFSLFTGENGRPVYFPLYPITTDGYRYQIELRGLDPNGFVIYGNQVGFFNSDGQSILYHNVLGQDAQVSNPDGGTKLSRPQYPTFLNPIDTTTLSYLERYKVDGTLDGVGIVTAPILPKVDSLTFSGTAGSNNSNYSTGGTFNFNSNTQGNYEIIISRDGTNFDPTHPQNRALIGVMANVGGQSVAWDGKDNSGNFFPNGTNYPARIRIRAGEYHFPMLDAENNYYGGPTIRLLNSTNPLGNTTAFYDDRGYKTINGTTVGTIGSPLCGLNPPNPAFSNPVSGFDSTTDQRRFGQVSGGNVNTKCAATGSFGDTKGLDLWTYVPSSADTTSLNIIPSGTPHLLLVKRITAINNVVFNQYMDDPNSTEDNDSNWPTPASTYLRGVINGGLVQPGDEVEYTIYFLSKGTRHATNVTICDLIPNHTTFLSTAFNGLTPTDNGLIGANLGIALALDSTKLPTAPNFYLSNVADPDRGQFIPPGQTLPSSCVSSNTQGAVIVNVVKSPNNLPNAIAAGNPTNSYGFVRFRVKVK